MEAAGGQLEHHDRAAKHFAALREQELHALTPGARPCLLQNYRLR